MARKENYIEAGMSSAAQRRYDAVQERKLRKQQEEAAQLTPGAEIIMNWIDEEIKEVSDLRHMVLHIADKELARDEILARKLHLDFLEKLKGRAGKMVRVADRQDKQAKRDNDRELRRLEREARENA